MLYVSQFLSFGGNRNAGRISTGFQNSIKIVIVDLCVQIFYKNNISVFQVSWIELLGGLRT